MRLITNQAQDAVSLLEALLMEIYHNLSVYHNLGSQVLHISDVCHCVPAMQNFVVRGLRQALSFSPALAQGCVVDTLNSRYVSGSVYRSWGRKSTIEMSQASAHIEGFVQTLRDLGVHSEASSSHCSHA